ncbi:MAG: DinB family protein [Bacteroidetes bacterium]|nr:DinB family protein [Bacteroidota bacterium]
MPQPEFWLRGPVENIPSLLQPVAHTLLQAREEVKESTKDFPDNKLWEKPGGAASVAFHLQHMAGVLDRLFTYAKGEQLNDQQLDYLLSEGKENRSISTKELFEKFSLQVDKAIEQLRQTDENTLLEVRGVGRKQIPATVAGLLFHAAEHTQRHNGQMMVTIKVLLANLHN